MYINIYIYIYIIFLLNMLNILSFEDNNNIVHIHAYLFRIIHVHV